MSDLKIPFNKPCIIGNELKYIQDSIKSGQISGDGIFSKKCQKFLEKSLGVTKALLTTSCTHALEMAALLMQFHPNDEVIIPSFAFVSTANAFVLHGASPVFIDSREDTLNLDERILPQKITANTKAIVVLHYAGIGCEMDRIMQIASSYNLSVIEDNAHGLFGKYKGKYLGSFGCLAAQSFHETKNFICGEGGALIINDPALIERAEIIREKGTNRARFFRGQVDKYTWIDFGSSYLPSDLLAAFLYGQLEAKEKVEARRKFIWHYYYERLFDWAQENHVHLPIIPQDCEHTYHIFYLIMPSLELRQSLIKFLRAKSIYSVFHYLPLHLSKMGQRNGGKPGDCPVSESISDRLLRLPFYFDLSEDDLAYIISCVKNFNFQI